MTNQVQPSVKLSAQAKSTATSQDRMLILTPSGAIRSVPLKQGRFRIGSVDDNDLLLNYDRVSPYHVEINYRNQNYYVTALNSTAGTVLGSQTLNTNEETLWTIDRVLRIGNCWLRLERRQSLEDSALFLQSGLNPSPANTTDSDLPIVLFVEASQGLIQPGQSNTTWLIVKNQGQKAIRTSLSATGPQEDWVRLSESEVTLEAGQEKEIKVTISPPELPSTQVGRHNIRLVATAANYTHHAEITRTVNVEAFFKFSSLVKAHIIRHKGQTQLVIENLGNTAGTFEVSTTALGEDQTDDLVFQPSQVQLQIPAGEIGTLDLMVAIRKKPLFGGLMMYPFKITVKGPGGQEYKHFCELLGFSLIPLKLK
jgi:pSer/pThr/pTyr-binding forkhead associated (FHA) protein